MKVKEVLLTEEQLYEISLKNALAAGALGATLLGSPKHFQQDKPIERPQARPAPVATVLPAPKKEVDPKQLKMSQQIAKKYKIDGGFAQEIVELAHKYQKPNFPKAQDILAVIGIESSFDPDAVSGLKRDPAVGLMQTRPGVWNLNREELENNVERQISTGSDILHLYYKKLKNRDAAIAAYNVGLGEFRNGNNAEGYVSKFQHELKTYMGI